MRFCAILKAFWAILEVVGDKEVGELTALRLACFSELPPSFAKVTLDCLLSFAYLIEFL